jgi:hypothetical protein
MKTLAKGRAKCKTGKGTERKTIEKAIIIFFPWHPIFEIHSKFTNEEKNFETIIFNFNLREFEK